MTRHRSVRAVAAVLVLAVAIGQLWNIFGLSQSTPTLSARFAFNATKCALRGAPDLLRKATLELDDKAGVQLVIEGRDIRIWTRSSRAGEAMYEAQGAALLRALDCGTSLWCEGKGGDHAYGPANALLAQRKRNGEAVVLQGCELGPDDFHPVEFEVPPLPRPHRFDALTIIAFITNLAVLAVLLRSLWR